MRRPRKARASALFAVALTTLVAVTGCSDTPEQMVAAGDSAMARGDFRAALVYLKGALQQDPENVRARWLLGEVHLALEDGPAAEKEIRRALQGGVGADAALPALGRAQLLQDRPDDVLALELPPGASVAGKAAMMATKGLAHLLKGEDEAADELTREAFALAPTARYALSSRARVLAKRGEYDEAARLVTQLQELYPDFGLAWSLMGDIEDLRGNTEAAEAAYGGAIEKRAVPYADIMKRALLRLRTGDLDGAIQDAATLTKAVPNLQRGWYVTGAVQFLKGDHPAAQEALSRAYELDRNHLQTVVLLGWANLSLGNVNLAQAQADRAMALAPNLVAARLLMASVQMRRQDPAAAEATVRPVVDAMPDNLQAKTLLIESLRAQGRGEEAAGLLVDLAESERASPDLKIAAASALIRARQPEKALAVLQGVEDASGPDPRLAQAEVMALIQSRDFDLALQTARVLQERNPSDPAALHALAVALAAKGDLDGAETTLRKALELLPGNPLLSLKLAEVLVGKGDREAAARIVDEAAAASPGNPALATYGARLAILQGRPAEAIASLEETVRENPSFRPARWLLAQQRLAQRDASGALAALPPEIGAADPMFMLLRGEAHILAGNWQAAKVEFEKLARVLPRSALMHYRLGQVYGALGDQAASYRSLEEAGKLAPRNDRIGLARARAMAAMGEFDEALAVARSLGLEETDPDLLATEIQIATSRGDAAERLRLAQQLHSVEPSGRNVLMLAKAYVVAGQAAAAETSLRQWLARNGEAGDVVAMVLAERYYSTGRTEEAIDVLEGAAGKYPGNANLLNNLAWYLLRKESKDSLEYAERAAALAPENPVILDTYAAALALDGRYAEARGQLEAAVSMAPQSAEYRVRLIETLLQSGDETAARNALESLEASGVPEALRARVEQIGRALGPR